MNVGAPVLWLPALMDCCNAFSKVLAVGAANLRLLICPSVSFRVFALASRQPRP